MSNKPSRSLPRASGGVLIVLFLALARAQGWLHSGGSTSDGTPAAAAVEREGPARSSGGSAVGEAFRERRSGVQVEGRGVVDRILADDREGSPHQRFVLRLEDGATVLVAHNIDLAPRVPAEPGDEVGFRGQYEWNERGGVLHWTHHDPAGSHPGGWLLHAGRRYE